MTNVSFDLLTELAGNPMHGWSIGSFGAIGEFVRDRDEPASIHQEAGLFEIITERGAMRIAPKVPLTPVAWDFLSSDGESWGHQLAFCCPRPETPPMIIRDLGCDEEALRSEDRSARLFDLGVGSGCVSMAVRTNDPEFIALLEKHSDQPDAFHPDIMADTLRAQPHRVLLSPAGRVEIFQPIPMPDGQSPEGPHTHLLRQLVPKDRAHSSNVPIPKGLQSALSLHPRSPWRTMLGERHDFIPEVDSDFAPYLNQFGLASDQAVEVKLKEQVANALNPETADWPDTRRGRTKARIVLRRMAAAGDANVAAWRAVYDRAQMEINEGENP